MSLFYPLKWNKTYAALGKTNTHLIAQKSWCKTNNSVNNPSANPHNRFSTSNEIPANKNMLKVSNKNFRYSTDICVQSFTNIPAKIFQVF